MKSRAAYQKAWSARRRLPRPMKVCEAGTYNCGTVSFPWLAIPCDSFRSSLAKPGRCLNCAHQEACHSA